MNNQHDLARLEYWAAKFFPHLLSDYGVLCVLACLNRPVPEVRS